MLDNAALIRTIVTRDCRNNNQRTGQYLVNILPPDLVTILLLTNFDPYEKDLSPQEVYEWVDNHLIFDEMNVIGLFDGDDILWDRDRPDMAVPTTVRS